MPSDFAMADTSSYNDPTVNKLLATASNDPSKAIEWTQGAQQIQQNQIKISSDQIALGRQKLAAADQVFGAIGSDPTQANAQARIMEAVKAGAVDYDTATQGFAQLMPLGDDPQKIKAWAFDHMARNATYDQQLQNMGMAPPTLVNTGGQLRPVTPQSGLKPSINDAGGGALPVTTTPAEKMGGVTTKNSDGSSTFRPNSTLYDDKGNFVGGGAGAAPSIPVYRGASGNSAPPATAGTSAGQGTPPANPPASGQGAPSPAAAAGLGNGGQAPAGPPPVYPAGSAGAATAASTSGAMMTPNPQSLPVITADMARAAIKAYQNGEATAANRNVMRGYAVQNNLTEQLRHMGPFEPQQAGVGAGVVVPPQPATGQGGASGSAPAGATAAPSAQPPQGAPPMRQVAGSDASLMERVPTPSPTQGSGAGLTVGLSPGQEASLKAGADTYSALSSDVTSPNGSNSRIFKIDRALDAIRNTTTGRGTAMRQEMLGYLDALPGGLGRLFPGVDPKDITNYDVATKYTNAIAQSSPGALRSDAGQSLASSANASTNGMTQQAATDVLTNQLGQERMNQAQLRAFNASNIDPGQFPKWSAQWTRNVDPRAFALADMTPDERSAVWSGLKGTARAAFAASVGKAIAGGVYTRADIMNPGAANDR